MLNPEKLPGTTDLRMRALFAIAALAEADHALAGAAFAGIIPAADVDTMDRLIVLMYELERTPVNVGPAICDEARYLARRALMLQDKKATEVKP